MGGGGSKQESVVDVTTNIFSQVVQKNVSGCSQTITNSEQLTITGCSHANVHDVVFNQSVNVNLVCLIQTLNNSEIQSEIAEDIFNEAKKLQIELVPDLEKFLEGDYTNEAKSAFETSVKSIVDEINVNTVNQNLSNSEGILVSGCPSVNDDINIVGVDFEQTIDGVMQSAITSENLQKILNNIQQTVTVQTSDTTLNIIAIVVAAILGILLLLLIIYLIARSGDKKKA